MWKYAPIKLDINKRLENSKNEGKNKVEFEEYEYNLSETFFKTLKRDIGDISINGLEAILTINKRLQNWIIYPKLRL